jgi:hypothetical protein
VLPPVPGQKLLESAMVVVECLVRHRPAKIRFPFLDVPGRELVNCGRLAVGLEPRLEPPAGGFEGHDGLGLDAVPTLGLSELANRRVKVIRQGRILRCGHPRLLGSISTPVDSVALPSPSLEGVSV